jgi:hypothetical protein
MASAGDDRGCVAVLFHGGVVMTWRWRLAKWLLQHEPEWMLVPTEHYLDYTRIIIEEQKVRAFLATNPHLVPTFETLSPVKKAWRH